jgi:hypothetical protein
MLFVDLTSSSETRTIYANPNFSLLKYFPGIAFRFLERLPRDLNCTSAEAMGVDLLRRPAQAVWRCKFL